MKINQEISIELPKDVKNIISVLTDNGYEAYAVGGCVRDSIIGRQPGDWDITTSALPGQVKALFRRTLDTGIQHGTVTVMIGKTGYEVTTYRIDGAYEDARHPSSVEFTSNLILDLLRRDFTINAMAYNDENGIVDAFDGIADLRSGIIRCVGDARERFGEDALRMLRAVRFCAQLGFTIEEKTADAVRQLAPSIAKISRERIHSEFNKLLLSGHPDYFRFADDLGIMEIIIPEFHSISDECKEMSGRLAKACAAKLPERYAAMLLYTSPHCGGDVSQDGLERQTMPGGSEAAGTVTRILRELKMDNDTIGMSAALVRWCGMELTQDERRLRHIIHDVGPERFLRVMEFRLAYEQAAGNGSARHEAALRQYELAGRIIARGDCLTLKELAITGRELMALGVPSGRQLGEALEELLMLVLDEPSRNTAEYLTEYATAKYAAGQCIKNN